MFKKSALVSLFLMIVILLSACSAVSLPGQGATGSSAQTVTDKLGVGILKLEGTDLAATTEQATTLLPLWKAVKALSTDSNVSSREMAALYDQIEGALTTQQVQAINQMAVSTSDLSALGLESQVKAQSGSATSASSAGAVADAGMDMSGDITGATGIDIQGTSAQSQPTTNSTTQTTAKTLTSLNVQAADAVITLLQKDAGKNA